MSSVTAVWDGDLHCHVTAHTFELIADAGRREGAKGPSPTDYLLIALASCYAAALAWEARKRQIELPDLSVAATGTYEGLRFSRIDLTVTTSLPREQLDRLIEPAMGVCYVSNTLIAGTPIEITVDDRG